MPHFQEAAERAERFADRYGTVYTTELGAGYDGIVFGTSAPSADKALRHDRLYRNEIAVYRRLEQQGVRSVEGFRIPRLIRADDERWTFEMSWVTPPFVLDFAGAYLDREPPWAGDEEVYGAWLLEKQEQFGERWSVVTGVLATFRRYGVYLADVKPGNIEFAHDDADE
ncbi:hypothetical protein CA12_09090 [Alienimonas californiensis]|uniref:Uncharacterized protein n=2 Tax=Alienimonas californiensis TaxID=2527989 RepID=A0A517P619_9PLAN|nr:hypothetical protein CA12_09090 [Alienimonas californiensis]